MNLKIKIRTGLDKLIYYMEEDMEEKLNPIEIVKQLRKENKQFMVTFGDDYIAYLEVLNSQVFEPNGYKLFVEKIDK